VALVDAIDKLWLSYRVECTSAIEKGKPSSTLRARAAIHNRIDVSKASAERP